MRRKKEKGKPRGVKEKMWDKGSNAEWTSVKQWQEDTAVRAERELSNNNPRRGSRGSTLCGSRTTKLSFKKQGGVLVLGGLWGLIVVFVFFDKCTAGRWRGKLVQGLDWIQLNSQRYERLRVT